MNATNTYRIAELPVRISFAENQSNSAALIPSFEPFRTDERIDDEQLMFHLHVDDSLQPIPETECEHIIVADTGNGDISVDQKADGGYQYKIKDLKGQDCCLLVTDKDFHHCQCALSGNERMRTFGLNNALMLIAAFAGSRQGLVLIHASLVRNDGWGYAFIAKSGTGKSTQVSLWLKHIPGSDMMNDDNPIVRVTGSGTFIYGSPWSGKTPCYRNVKAPLGAVSRIVRDKENFVEKVSPVAAFASLIPSCSAMKWDVAIYENICKTITKIVETTPIYNLHCRPDKEAALVCREAISRSGRS